MNVRQRSRVRSRETRKGGVPFRGMYRGRAVRVGGHREEQVPVRADLARARAGARDGLVAPVRSGRSRPARDLVGPMTKVALALKTLSGPMTRC